MAPGCRSGDKDGLVAVFELRGALERGDALVAEIAALVAERDRYQTALREVVKQYDLWSEDANDGTYAYYRSDGPMMASRKRSRGSRWFGERGMSDAEARPPAQSRMSALRKRGRATPQRSLLPPPEPLPPALPRERLQPEDAGAGALSRILVNLVCLLLTIASVAMLAFIVGIIVGVVPITEPR